MSTVPRSAAARPSVGRRRPDRWALLAVPALLVVLVVFLYPVAEILRRSVTDFLVDTDSGLANYQWFFSTEVNLTVLRRTLVTALLVTLVCLVLAYPYAYLMTKVRRRVLVVMLAAATLPFWTSLMARNYAWVALLQEQGPINDALEWLGLGRVELIGTTAGVTIGMVQILLPYMVLPLYAVLRGIDRRLLAAAQSLGAPPRVAFLRVYVPLSLPGVVAGCLMVFVLALGFYITPALLGAPSNSLLSQLMVNQVNDLLAFGRGGVMAVVLIVATVLLLLPAGWLARRAPGGGGLRGSAA